MSLIGDTLDSMIAPEAYDALKKENERLTTALQKISDIRDSIVGLQGFNFSEHAYPLVAVLDGAGFKGKGYEIASKNLGTLIEQIKAAEAEVERLTLIITNHQKQRGDDRCYLDDLEMYSQVGLTEGNTALPPKEEFLKNCARYHDSRQAPGHTYQTVAEQLKPLEDQIQELKQKLAERIDRHDIDGKALIQARRELQELQKKWGDEDGDDKFSAIIERYNPARGGPEARHDLMMLAMELIGPRKSKFSIVFLLVALLADSKEFLKRGGIKDG